VSAAAKREVPDRNRKREEARGKRRTKTQERQDSDNDQHRMKQRIKQRMKQRNIRATTADNASKALPLVKLAHSVFDMLSQQTTFVRRHMSVTAALIEIGGNCGTQHCV
jgi:hypothetical protein